MASVSMKWQGLEKILSRAGAAKEQAVHTVAIQAQKDTSPFVPALTGSLDARTKVSKGTITYPGPYARFLYEGKVMVDPDTGSPYARAGATKIVTSKDLVFNRSMHSQAQAHWFDASKAQNVGKWIDVAKKAVKHEF